MNTRSLFNPTTTALKNVRHEVERMFDNVFAANASSRAYPAINLIEDDETIRIEAELPGIVLEDLDITVADGILTLRGRRMSDSHDDASALRRERTALEFERSLTLPSAVESDRTEAVLRNGVLTITVPKSESARMRKVHVTQG